MQAACHFKKKSRNSDKQYKHFMTVKDKLGISFYDYLYNPEYRFVYTFYKFCCNNCIL